MLPGRPPRFGSLACFHHFKEAGAFWPHQEAAVKTSRLTSSSAVTLTCLARCRSAREFGKYTKLSSKDLPRCTSDSIVFLKRQYRKALAGDYSTGRLSFGGFIFLDLLNSSDRAESMLPAVKVKSRFVTWWMFQAPSTTWPIRSRQRPIFPPPCLVMTTTDGRTGMSSLKSGQRVEGSS